MKKRIIIAVIILTLIAGAVYFARKIDGRLTGIVEPTIYSYVAEVGGNIKEMPIELGQHVKAGDVLLVLDSANQEYAIEQLELTLQKKILEASDLSSGKNSSQAQSNIDIAGANYSSALLAYEKAKEDYAKAKALYENGGIPKDALDNAKLRADTASAAANAAKAQLNIASGNTKLNAAELDVKIMKSQLQQQKDNLGKFTIKAGQDGIIMTKSYVAGDLVSPGYNLVEIASGAEKYLVFYLPKDDLSRIEYDQPLKIKSKGEEFTGTVKFINLTSEYTPKDFQTTANKNKESIKIKLLLPADTKLAPGEEAEVII
ncbi:HlyD family efflux transporter periplasmic adaptor subunit [Bacillota bacterium]